LKCDGFTGRKHTELSKKKISESVRKTLSKKEIRAKISIASRRFWQKEENRQTMRERMLGNNISKVNSEVISQKAKKRWSHPMFREKMAKIFNDTSYKKNKSTKAKKNWCNPLYKNRVLTNQKKAFQNPAILAKMTKWGAENHNWRGGIAFEPYGQGFTQKFKDKIKTRDNNNCALCSEVKNIDIHHIDFNKKNNVEENLISLCKHCHRKIHKHNILLQKGADIVV